MKKSKVPKPAVPISDQTIVVQRGELANVSRNEMLTTLKNVKGKKAELQEILGAKGNAG